MLPLRWLVATLLAAVLLGACNDGSDSSPEPTATSTSTAAQPTETPTTDDPGIGARPPLGSYSGTAHALPDPAFEAIAGATAHYGQLGDAVYRIEMPDDWNGSVFMYAHGFKGFGTTLDVDSPRRPAREWLVENGYAWAASSYSENGYNPGIGADDTAALLDHFSAEFGEPEYAYLFGLSMGGNVVALSLEHFEGLYDGALALCGAMGGQRQIDFLVAWAFAAAFVAGVEVPQGGSALELTAALTGQVSPALGPVDNPTVAGEQFRSVIREISGGPRPFFEEGYAEQYVVNFGFILTDPALETVTARAATNEYIDYAVDESLGITAEAINAGVYRQLADPEARNAEAHPDKVPTSGRITAPLLSLHNTGDLFVPISHQQYYLEAVTEAGAADLLVQRAIRDGGHCEFSDEEYLTALEDLVAWVEDGVKPAGDDLSGDLSDIGMQFTDPVRPGDPGGR